MFKILLCHRRRGWFGARRFHRHWRQDYKELVLELRADLGYSRYAQLHQVCGANPLYQGIRATRGRLFTWLLARKRGVALPDRPGRTGERWDVADELWYPSRAALVAALTSPRGLQAARRLTEAREGWVRRTAIVVAQERVAAAPSPAPPRAIRTMLCLRRVDGMTREAMHAYWTGEHRELVLRLRGDLGYLGYDQLLARRDPELDAVVGALGGPGGAEYDGIAGLTFPSQWALLKGLFSLRAQRANLTLVGDELGFIDAARSTLVFGDRDEIYPAAADARTCERDELELTARARAAAGGPPTSGRPRG